MSHQNVGCVKGTNFKDFGLFHLNSQSLSGKPVLQKLTCWLVSMLWDVGDWCLCCGAVVVCRFDCIHVYVQLVGIHLYNTMLNCMLCSGLIGDLYFIPYTTITLHSRNTPEKRDLDSRHTPYSFLIFVIDTLMFITISIQQLCTCCSTQNSGSKYNILVSAWSGSRCSAVFTNGRTVWLQGIPYLLMLICVNLMKLLLDLQSLS